MVKLLEELLVLHPWNLNKNWNARFRIDMIDDLEQKIIDVILGLKDNELACLI